MGFFGWLLGRKSAPAQQPPPAPVAPPPQPPSAKDILAALQHADDMVATGVPAAVTSRVHRVTSTIRKTLPRMSSEGMQSNDSYSLMATATDYLPEALSAYQRLPRDWADTRPIENGKTALMLLIDQLDLLGWTMEKIYDAINTADAAALIANGRFLQAKFGGQTHGGSLTLGDAPVASTPANPLDLTP